MGRTKKDKRQGPPKKRRVNDPDEAAQLKNLIASTEATAREKESAKRKAARTAREQEAETELVRKEREQDTLVTPMAWDAIKRCIESIEVGQTFRLQTSGSVTRLSGMLIMFTRWHIVQVPDSLLLDTIEDKRAWASTRVITLIADEKWEPGNFATAVKLEAEAITLL